MVTAPPFRPQRPARRFGPLAIAFALFCQLVFGPAAIADELAMASGLDTPFVICVSHGGGGDGGGVPVHHHPGCCAFCPLNLAHAAMGIVPTAVPAVPLPPPALVMWPGGRPRVRAPPRRAVVAAFPRGPPSCLA